MSDRTSRHLDPLTDKEFQQIAEFVEDHLGIKMPPSKKTMLQSRLQTRVLRLELDSYADYIAYVFRSERDGEEELIHMIDVITTNKTDFFRENDHFKFLTDTALPEIATKQKALKIWSAGCSTGEEPYTIMMVLEEFNRKSPNKLNYSIIATDISTRVLKRAFEGIYRQNVIDNLAPDLRKRYFMKSRDSKKDLVRIKPEYRSKIVFRRLNFMDDKFPMDRDFDIIFCRNVIIYFEKAVQEKVIAKFCQHLKSKCLLFLGHSETILGMTLPLDTVAPTVYRRK